MTNTPIAPNDRFYLLTVLRQSNDGRPYHWICQCVCGLQKTVYAGHLRAGCTTSCGSCGRQGVNRKHGMAQSPEYKAWDNARARCRNPKNKKYPDYGGRGIRMCDAWTSSFAAFFAELGRRPSSKHSLDRIDGDGNYEPGNCRWATSVEQNRNRKHFNRTVMINGKLHLLIEAVEITGINYATALSRLNAGKSDEEAIHVR